MVTGPDLVELRSYFDRTIMEVGSPTSSASRAVFAQAQQAENLAAGKKVVDDYIKRKKLFLERESRMGIKMGDTTYTIQNPPLREAADNVYKVTYNGEISVIKEAGSGREGELGREANLMEQVGTHTNVVKLLDRAKDNSKIRLEYEQFGKFETYTADTKAKAQRLAKGIIAGINYIHEKGVGHGDMDAKNILIGGTTTEPVAKVADFGSGFSTQEPHDGLMTAAERFRLKLPADIVGSSNLLRRLVLGTSWEQEQASQTFLTSVNQVRTAAVELNMLANYGEIPSVEAIATLRQQWQALAQSAWLS